MHSLTRECVLLLENVLYGSWKNVLCGFVENLFSYQRMRSLTRECVVWVLEECVIWVVKNVLYGL